MARRVWVIAKKDKVEQADFDAALANSCPELVNGIPLALATLITEDMLPFCYEEPEPPIPIPLRDLIAEIDEIKVEVETLKN